MEYEQTPFDAEQGRGTMPYTIDGARERLAQADAVRALEFFVCHTDGKTHGFSARCWDTLNTMKDADKFVEELNAAIRPVTKKWLSEILDDVKAEFPLARL